MKKHTFLSVSLLLVLWWAGQPAVYAQDTLKPTLPKRPSPGRVALMSAVVPGLGQLQNKKYWKLPIVYGGGAALGYFIYYNNTQHLGFKDSYLARLNGFGNDPYPRFRTETVELNKDYFRRNRDFLVIISLLCYGLQILDAAVDAHLRDFDVSDGLSLRLSPMMDNVGGAANAGISIKLLFK